MAKASAGVIGPVEMTFYRWLGAAALLAPLAIGPIIRNRAALFCRLPRLILLGLLGCVLFPYLMYLAAPDTSAITIGIIQALMPVMALGLSRMLSGAAIGRGAFLGAVVSLFGVIVVVSHGQPGMLFSHPINRGDAIMLAATACFAIYSVLLERWRSELPLSAELFVQVGAANVILLPAFLLAREPAIARSAMPLILYAAAAASVAAPLLWMKGVARIGPTRAATFFNLLPVITAVLAIAVLGEALTGALVSGGLLAIAGVALAERAAKV